eukprot:14952196-Ditylum_brightwellii.AAC.1
MVLSNTRSCDSLDARVLVMLAVQATVHCYKLRATHQVGGRPGLGILEEGMMMVEMQVVVAV